MTPAHAVCNAALCLLLSAVPAHAAQDLAVHEGDDLASGFAVLSANALIAGGTAAVRALFEQRDPGPAFLRGALGGAVGFAGKRVAVTGWDAAPITGRVLASVGNGIVANATSPVLLDEVTVPLGPARVRVPVAGGRPRFELVVYDLAVLVRWLAASELSFDLGRTLRTGAPVFVTKDYRIRFEGGDAGGFAGGGVIVLDEAYPNGEAILHHEMIHVLQHDFLGETWERPVESWIRAGTPAGRVLPGWLRLGVLFPVAAEFESMVFTGDGPFNRLGESEAEWFQRR